MDDKHEMAIRLINGKLLEIDREIKKAASERDTSQMSIDNLTRVQKALEFSKAKLMERGKS